MLVKKNKQPQDEQSSQLASAQLQECQVALHQAQEKEKRALADYQNLLRRTREERLQIIKMANKDLILSLIEPFENLHKATALINDQGLTMAVNQLWQQLAELGVEIIDPAGQKFDLNTMEVVEKKGDANKVISVVRRGYKLDGQVIGHAKVVIA